MLSDSVEMFWILLYYLLYLVNCMQTLHLCSCFRSRKPSCCVSAPLMMWSVSSTTWEQRMGMFPPLGPCLPTPTSAATPRKIPPAIPNWCRKPPLVSTCSTPTVILTTIQRVLMLPLLWYTLFISNSAFEVFLFAYLHFASTFYVPSGKPCP